MRHNQHTPNDQCATCLRIVDPHDQDLTYKHGDIVACGSCKPSSLPPNPVPKKRRSTTLRAAVRYKQRFGGKIVSGSIREPLRLLRGTSESGYFFVAEMASLFSPRR